MTLALITNTELAPTFATCREIDFQLNHLGDKEKEVINAIAETYGFDFPSELVDGDPRKLIISQEEVDFLGFHNGKFGVLMEFEIADGSYGEENIKNLHSELSKAFTSEECEILKVYDKSEFFFTQHRDNINESFNLVIFTPLVLDGVKYSSPYESETALKDIVLDTFECLNKTLGD